MSLEVYSRYYNPDSRKTVVAIHDSDQAVFVRFDAVLDGNQIELPEAELLDRAVDWFTNRYIQTYANQKLDGKVREVEALTAQMKQTLDEADQSIDKMEEQLALNNLSRLAQLQLMTLLVRKGVLTDEDLAEAGLFDVEDDDLLDDDDESSDGSE